MREATKGVLAIVGTSMIWGLSGLYYKALAAVPPLEVLSHRTLWSIVFLGGVLLVQRRLGEAAAAMRQPRWLAVLTLTAALVAANWLGFIHAVQAGEALQASLGYYIFPLFTVALGFLVLGERFGSAQSLAIGLAALAVLVLTIGLGQPPWLALFLASTFALYGLVKTRLPLGPVVSVLVETVILAPLALVWLWGLHSGAWTDLGGRGGGFFGRDAWTTALLVLSGPLTGGPLVLFSYAARRIDYATLGLIAYLNPTLQFLVAVLVFGEAFTAWHAIAFGLIWIGLALYSWASWRSARSARSRAVTVSQVAR